MRSGNQGRVLFTLLLCINTLHAGSLPDHCGTIGASRYSTTPFNGQITIPTIPLERGIVITVANSSDDINGDASTVSALVQNPGIDGISLREAVMATNNDPGSYTIRFSPQMKGAVIKIGPQQLPELKGGHLIINGDIDGDGNPDVTLQNEIVTPYNSMGLVISSTEIVLHALAISGFNVCILIRPLAIRETYENIAISNCLFYPILNPNYGGGGIILIPSWPEGTYSQNHWIGTTIVNNKVDGEGAGISFMLHSSAGDTLERTTVVDNTINIASGWQPGIGLSEGYGTGSNDNRISQTVIARNHIRGVMSAGILSSAGVFAAASNVVEYLQVFSNSVACLGPPNTTSCGFGIQVSAGFWPGSERNQVTSVLIADNSVEGSAGNGIAIMSGAVGASRNTISNVSIGFNRIQLSAEAGGEYGPTSLFGIAALAGDAATDYFDPSFQPIVYADANRIENLSIINNSISGAGSGGIQLLSGNWGGEANNIQGVWILGNDVSDIGYPGPPTYGIRIHTGDGRDPTTQKASQNNWIADVELFGNTLRLKPQIVHGISGGIAVMSGGDGAKENSIRGIQVAYNEIDPGGVLGINLIGGYGAPNRVSIDNQLAAVECWCNSVSSSPDPDAGSIGNLTGIAAIGGMGGAISNRLIDLHLVDNIVAGILDDYSVVPNLDPDSTGNTIQISDGAIVTPAFIDSPSGGEAGTISVLTQADNSWTSASDQPWIKITSGASGDGAGTVTYTIEPNPSLDSRAASLTIAGRTVTVNQAAAGTSLLLNNNRFLIEIDWSTTSGASGKGTAVPLTSDSGYFWFFDHLNVELMVKILDGRAVNGHFWVFYGAMTDVQYTITVTDTTTGLVKTYLGQQGIQQSGNDINAFADSAAAFRSPALDPAKEAMVFETALQGLTSSSNTALAGDTSTLRLNGNRFTVQINWSTPSGISGQGTAVPLTSDSGYFWFFGDTNVEVLVKILDGRGTNGHFWFFWGAITDVQYSITVTDTGTGAVRTYEGQQGVQRSGNDIMAF